MNDASRVLRDPAIRLIVACGGRDRIAATTSQLVRFETELLSMEENLPALTGLSGDWVERVHDRKTPKINILDRDSSESLTHGAREACGPSTFNQPFKA